jgi:hypothetical protein
MKPVPIEFDMRITKYQKYFSTNCLLMQCLLINWHFFAILFQSYFPQLFLCYYTNNKESKANLSSLKEQSHEKVCEVMIWDVS